jgi:predicted dehydrogenase
MDKIKTAVIGTGHLGKHHTRILKQIPGAELIGICDRDENSRNEISSKWDVAGFADYRELMDRVDAVIIATPTITHHEICVEFLQSGIHVFVEKPIAHNLDQANHMVETARNQKLILQVGHSERFNPAFIAAVNHIDKPRFIECHRLNMFALRGTDVDVVLDLMIHDLDIVLHFMKMFPDRIDSVGVPVLSHEIDIANTRLNFANNAVANLTASRVSVRPVRKFRVFQEDMYISMDLKELKVDIFKRNPPRKEDELPLIQKIPAEIDDAEPLYLEISEFIQSVQSGQDPQVTGEVGTEALKAALMVIDGIQQHPLK